MQKSEKTVVADENFALRTKQRRTEEQGEIQRALPLARVSNYSTKSFLSKFPSKFFPELNNFHLYK